MMHFLISLSLLVVILLGAQGNFIKAKPGIVDGGGYTIRSAAYLENNLVMEATSPDSGEAIGTVTLQANVNFPSQKWGVEFFGSITASLSSGMNRQNNVTVYLPPGSFRPQSRQYTFESTNENETFKIKNSETKMCLGIIGSEPNLVVDFALCNNESDLIYWVFERTG